MRSAPQLAVALLVLWFGETFAFGVTSTFAPSQDTTLYQQNFSGSNGQGVAMYVGRVGTKDSASTGTLRRGLIEFDLSAIPIGSVVTSVTLTLTMTLSAPDDAAAQISLYQVLQAWGEGASLAPAAGGVGAPARPGDATWNQRFFGVPGATWTTLGGHFDPVASSTRTVGQVANGDSISYNWVGAGLVGDVQEWVDNPTGNFGWIIRGDESTNQTARRFATGESTVPSHIPKLTVIFTVPEPGAGALLLWAMGVMGLVRVRWR